MTFRISKYTHNSWKAPQQFKNPESLIIKRFSLPNIILGSMTFFGCIFSFRFLAKKLVGENVLIQEKVKILILFHLFIILNNKNFFIKSCLMIIKLILKKLVS